MLYGVDGVSDVVVDVSMVVLICWVVVDSDAACPKRAVSIITNVCCIAVGILLIVASTWYATAVADTQTRTGVIVVTSTLD